MAERRSYIRSPPPERNRPVFWVRHSMQLDDESERELWKNSIEAGNLYINRGITGAIVQRQPFGGMKRSAFGGGIKAGGPNYVSCFVNFTENKPKAKKTTKSAEKLQSCRQRPVLYHWQNHLEIF